MIQALETTRPLAGSIVKTRPTVGSVSLNSETKAANNAPIAFLSQATQAPSPFGRLKAALLKYNLMQGTPSAASDPVKKSDAAATKESAPTPTSEAENMFIMRTGAARYAVENSEDLKDGTPREAGIDTSASGLREMTILAKGIQFPKLDASWQILPTAEFAKQMPGKQLELLV